MIDIMVFLNDKIMFVAALLKPEDYFTTINHDIYVATARKTSKIIAKIDIP